MNTVMMIALPICLAAAAAVGHGFGLRDFGPDRAKGGVWLTLGLVAFPPAFALFVYGVFTHLYR